MKALSRSLPSGSAPDPHIPTESPDYPVPREPVTEGQRTVRYPNLITFGWTERRDHALVDTALTVPGRVVRHDRGGWTVATNDGELLSDLRGRLRGSRNLDERPGVGDWVVVTARADEGQATIEAVLPRTGTLRRSVAGRRAEAQLLAANVDTVFVCVPADAPSNPRRVERSLAMVRDSGAEPVIVLTKSDLAGEGEGANDWLRGVVLGAPIVTVHALGGGGTDALAPWLKRGSTVVVVGPSGAGKSTLANALLGELRLATGAVREDDGRGRHTTSWRELIVLPSGALLIDTPGIRELALWDASGGLDETFDEVATVAESCHFNDCSHGNEPGCAIRDALADGTLDRGRYESWQKLRAELANQAQRQEERVAAEDRRKKVPTAKPGRSQSSERRRR